jgi:hypothetical protein
VKSKEGEVLHWIHSSFLDGHFPVAHEEVNRLIALFHGLEASLGLKDLVSVLELSLEVDLKGFPCWPLVVSDEVFNQGSGPQGRRSHFA